MNSEAGFVGFRSERLSTSRGEVNAVVGGSGPPVLLLHGYPESLVMWRDAASRLAERFTVVATDLAGYGESFHPKLGLDHAPYGKRAMALDQVEAMSALGFDRFYVAGHDRGGRVAYRMALDHPDRVLRLAVLDIVPTAEVYRLAGSQFSRFYWHWAFLAQPSPLPENLIGADPQTFFDVHVRNGMGLGVEAGRYPRTVLATYRAALDRREAVEAMCEDYRAGATIDLLHDEVDLAAGVGVRCPTLVLWSARGSLPRVYDDVLKVWRRWAPDVSGRALDAGHFLVEDQPEQTAEELTQFFGVIDEAPNSIVGAP